MAENEIDLKEWGSFTQAVRTLTSGFEEMRDEFKELRRSIGTRCTDCALSRSFEEFKGDVKRGLEKHEERLRFLEVKVAGISIASGMASAYLTHLLTR